MEYEIRSNGDRMQVKELGGDRLINEESEKNETWKKKINKDIEPRIST